MEWHYSVINRAILVNIGLIAVIARLTWAAQFLSFTKNSFPDPREDFAACGRDRESWICDPGGFLTQDQADELDELINSLPAIGSRNAIIVAVVPSVLQDNGVETTDPQLVREFTHYLQQTKWRDYADTVLVILYHVSGKEVWVQSDAGTDVSDCICQLTYESQQYINEGFNTVLNIFAIKLVDVLSGEDKCTPPGDAVPWKTDITGACTWESDKKIVIKRVEGLTARPEGGTQLVIIGENLDMTQGPVLLGNLECQPISRSSTEIVCTVPPVQDNGDVNKPLTVSLELNNGQAKFDTGQRFSYGRPVLTTIRPLTTTLSGGLRLTVEGRNLDLAKSAYLETTLTGLLTGRTIVNRTECTVRNSTEMLCPTPHLNIEDVLRPKRKRRHLHENAINHVVSGLTDATSGESNFHQLPPEHSAEHVLVRIARAATGPLRRISDHFVINTEKRSRKPRATNDEGAPSERIPGINVTAAVFIDGEQLPLIGLAGSPQSLGLTVYEDGQLFAFAEEGMTRDFVSTWPVSQTDIEIKGSKLLPGLAGHTLDIEIGLGFCDNVSIFSNLVVCSPPKKQPPTGTALPDPHITASIGNSPFNIGYLRYYDSLWKYLPTRYTVIGVVTGVTVITGVLVGCCIGCLLRKREKAVVDDSSVWKEGSESGSHG